MQRPRRGRNICRCGSYPRIREAIAQGARQMKCPSWFDGPVSDLPGDQSGDFTGEFVRHLGIEITEVTGDRVVAEWEAAAKHHQPYGIVHGGVHCSVIETLASFGAATWLGDKGQVVGVNNNTDFYRAVREGPLTSTATPIHRGRTQQVWVVETVDAEGRVVARGQVRLQNLYPRG
jgi:1,4-dihydroxy-2-naphthoyl-CoA hydrolase